ncbi:MAG: hydrolase [Frankiales bacterium]|nr:hydrolase [Frankiales bacterium]
MHDYDVRESETVFRGRVISLRRDVVAMPGKTTSQRDVVVHPGAVGVVALRGEEVLLVNQYRHPVQRRLDELPAGLLDVEGEPGLQCGQRELMEEAGYAADTWHVLVDILTSPGMTDESIRIFLARDLREVERDVQEHEELEMTTRWASLDQVVAAALAGELENGACVAGVLAAFAAVQRGFSGLRPPDAPWRARPTH